MTDPRAIAPLTPSSKLLSTYWWLLCLAPPLNLLLALEPVITGRPPEQAMGGFISVPLLIATLLLAPVIMVRALVSPVLSGKQKVLCLVLGIASFPMFLLTQGIWSALGSSRGLDSGALKLALTGGVVLWMALAWLARTGIRRNGGADQPPGTSP